MRIYYYDERNLQKSQAIVKKRPILCVSQHFFYILELYEY
jgi:hypothetical protein